MNSPLILSITTFIYGLSSFLYIAGWVFKNNSCGRFATWVRPTETWSLITWFVYATFLHARLTRGWQGKQIAYLSVTGFIAVMFTYFGVNYLPGLHRYGS